MLADRRYERRRQRLAAGVAVHVDDANAQLDGTADGGRQHQFQVAALADVWDRLGRRRRGAEREVQLEPLRPLDGEVAGGIAEAGVLFVRWVVLVVDDDAPGGRRRREVGRPSSDDEPSVFAVR